MALVDSHCHIDFPELLARIDDVVGALPAAGVSHALCVCVNMEDFPRVLSVAERFPNVFASVGVHPDHEEGAEPSLDDLVSASRHPRVVAIGETGLDYYRHPERRDVQRERFATHIAAARATNKPLIVHTRAAAADTLELMRSERAAEPGGVMHCFTETWDVAKGALDLGFHISFSGIVTFRNAQDLRDVAQKVPLDRLLVETDSPYLAPVPHRGKTNEPAFVQHVAACIAEVRGMSPDALAEATTANFFALFSTAVA
ncbi:MAG: TatD family hydrolase [Betaproteobacteria bacterium]|nr:TatD family hydrolase [Betaproteobacteria bacterium]